MAQQIIERMAVRVSSPVLIGRSRELDALTAALRRADDGHSSATVVAGEAGVGKTRLVAEFAELARATGATVLVGGCIDLGEGSLPYAPVVEALRGLVRHASAKELDAVVGQGRSELARLLPDLGPVDEEGSSGLSLGSSQGRLFELLLGVLLRVAARAPVVFVVEDLHWSDRSTRDLLGFLVRNLHDASVMLVITYRSDELHRRHPLLPFLAELERTNRVERLELRPFDRRDVAAQLRAIAGHDLDPALVESIHGRSGGNAFFAEELLAAAGDDGSSELPSTLRDVLLARVADLAEPTQEFLRVASAAGQRVDPSLLAAAASLDEAALYEALRESVARQVLVPDPTAGKERYAFRHALLQEAVYDDLLPGERTRLHSAFARTLETSTGDDPSHAAELAYHWYAAHDLPCALEATVAAGIDAEARYAFHEAQVHYERAIELWDQVPDAESRAHRGRVDLLGMLAGVARFHEPARAVAHIQAAIALVDEAREPVRSGLLHERLGRYAWISGQGQLAHESYRKAARLIPAEPPSQARARVVAGFAQILTLGGRFAEAVVLADEALALARQVGARDIEGHALNTRAIARMVVYGDLDGALAALDISRAIAEELGIVDDIGRTLANRVWVMDTAGRLEEALALSDEGIAVPQRLGLMRFFGTHLLCGAADFLYQLGRWDEAERALEQARDFAPLGINRILEQELIGRFAVARGHFDEAAEHLRPLAVLAERAIDIQFVVPVQTSLAELALWQGQPQTAANGIAAAIAHIEFTPEVRVGELFALGLRANADAAERARARRSGDDEARALAAGEGLLEASRRRNAEVLTERPTFEGLSAAWLALCEAESTRLHRRPDPDAWTRCIDAWQQLDRPYVVAYARWRLAEAILAARGDRASACAALRSALDTAERLRAEPLAQEVRALAGRARLSMDVQVVEETPLPSDDAARLGLTAREREVLSLVALGRTNRQIADALFISENTAGVHVSNILGKLDVTGRGEAAAVAYRLGLVEPAGAS